MHMVKINIFLDVWDIVDEFIWEIIIADYQLCILRAWNIAHGY